MVALMGALRLLNGSTAASLYETSAAKHRHNRDALT